VERLREYALVVLIVALGVVAGAAVRLHTKRAHRLPLEREDWRQLHPEQARRYWRDYMTYRVVRVLLPVAAAVAVAACLFLLVTSLK
jgi:hypothetical protein